MVLAERDAIWIVLTCLVMVVFTFIGYMSRDNSSTDGDFKECFRHWQSGYNAGHRDGYKSGVKDGRAKASGSNDIKNACRSMRAILNKLDGDGK